MSGNSEGSKKAVATILARDPDFYKKIGAKSWDNPDRSHETGFALVPEKLRKELGAKGGSKTKKDYKTKDRTPKEEALTAPTEAYKTNTGVSE